jgi:protein-L-isoaspartate(D-aspartate) O-methyltransferase
VEVVEEFASHADERLHQLGHSNVTVRVGDGTRGWAEHAPFNKILVTAAAEQPPEALLNQLAPGGLMVLPLGPEETQQLTVTSKQPDGQTGARAIIPVRFGQLETTM